MPPAPFAATGAAGLMAPSGTVADDDSAQQPLRDDREHCPRTRLSPGEMPTVWAQPSSALTRPGGGGGDGGGACGAGAHLYDDGGNVGCARRNRCRRCRTRLPLEGGARGRAQLSSVRTYCGRYGGGGRGASAAGPPRRRRRRRVGRARHHRCRRRRERLAPVLGARLGNIEKSLPPSVATVVVVAAALVRATATRPAQARSRGPRPPRTAAVGVTARRLVPTAVLYPGDNGHLPSTPDVQKSSASVRCELVSTPV